MKSLNPPRLAVWLLEHFGPENNSEALAGDLCEDFRQGRSKAWYWRQVAAAIHWREHLSVLLRAATVGWLLSWPVIWGSRGALGGSTIWPLDMVVIASIFVASNYLPAMLPGVWRAFLVLLIVTFFLLLCRHRLDLASHYLILPMILSSSLIFNRKRQPPPAFQMTFRELLRGDANQERKRLITTLEGTMEQESNPELRQAYAQAITVLESSKETPIVVKEKP